MDKQEVKQKVNTNELCKQLGLDPLMVDLLIEDVFRVWEKTATTESFPCVEGCTDCCSNAAITCTILEWQILKVIMPVAPNSGFGCPYKTKKGCAVYDYRPLVCRLFGYMVPYKIPVVRVREELAGEIFDWLVIAPGFCVKKRLQTSLQSEHFYEIMKIYKEIVDKTTIVIAGLFKDKELNRGLLTIDKFWSVKKNMHIWHRD